MEDSNNESYYLGPRSLGIKLNSPMGMGLWSWGDSLAWGYNSYDSALSETTMKQAYSEALKGGVNLMDTAESYGMGLWGGWGTSERILGSCIADAGSKGQRSDVVIVTKYQPLPWRFREPKSMLEALEASCNRLGVDQVDVLLLHNPLGSLRSFNTIANALGSAVESGRAKAVGVSNHSAAEVTETHRILAERGIPLAVNQVEFSLCHRLPETSGLLSTCADLDISVMGYSPLAMGRLTGKYSSSNLPKGGRRFGSYSFDQIQPIIDVLSDIGSNYGNKSPAQVALNWVISKGAIPIPGAKNGQQAASNTGALDFRLTPDEVERLDEVAITGCLKFGQHG